MSRFVQIHFLSSYPGTLLNRDDVGFAKRMPLGGATRTRISSQCLKRHWRTFDGEHSFSSLGVARSVRSRHTFDRYILEPLLQEGIPEEVAVAVVEGLMAAVLGESAKAKSKKKEPEEQVSVQTGQITVLGHPEVKYLLDMARDICVDAPEPKKAKSIVKETLSRDVKKNLKVMSLNAGVDAAMFGRMVTSDILARGDAAIHVAHAFTVHEEQTEADYFSAVDDLQQSGDDAQLGSGHIGSTELTSGLFYGYVVVDIPLLVSNLTGCGSASWEDADRELAAQLVTQLVHLVATVSPGAKLGSTAPYSYAHFVGVEWGASQPRSLANAFLRPVVPRPDLVQNTYQAVVGHLAALDSMYGVTTQRAFAALEPSPLLAEAMESRLSIPELADWVGTKVRGEQ